MYTKFYIIHHTRLASGHLTFYFYTLSFGQIMKVLDKLKNKFGGADEAPGAAPGSAEEPPTTSPPSGGAGSAPTGPSYSSNDVSICCRPLMLFLLMPLKELVVL